MATITPWDRRCTHQHFNAVKTYASASHNASEPQFAMYASPTGLIELIEFSVISTLTLVPPVLCLDDTAHNNATIDKHVWWDTILLSRTLRYVTTQESLSLSRSDRGSQEARVIGNSNWYRRNVYLSVSLPVINIKCACEYGVAYSHTIADCYYSEGLALASFPTEHQPRGISRST